LEDISLHILDIVENSIAVSASRVEVTICEDIEKDLLTIEIKDNGSGMSEETLKKVLDPFFTTKSVRKVGLGLPLLAQAAKEGGGVIKIDSKVGEGTRVKATFQYSHPDRKPLGNIAETMKILKVTNPNIEFVYKYEKTGSERVS